jgi:hypothetical protein
VNTSSPLSAVPACSVPTIVSSCTGVPDGTFCGDGGICQDGVCLEVYSLTLSIARLRINTAKPTSTHPNGSVSVNALVNDNSTGGMLPTDLVNGVVTLDVTDLGTSFHTTIPVTGCVAGLNGMVRCRSASGAVRALILRVPAPAPLPNVYKLSVSQSKLTTTLTGSTQVTGPLNIVLHQSSVTRPTSVTASHCKPLGKSNTTCKGL